MTATSSTNTGVESATDHALAQVGVLDEPIVDFTTHPFADPYPSFVGGEAMWLASVSSGSGSGSAIALRCAQCDSTTLRQLAQVYAPQDEPAHAYHRYIHVHSCLRCGTLRAQRAQESAAHPGFQATRTKKSSAPAYELRCYTDDDEDEDEEDDDDDDEEYGEETETENEYEANDENPQDAVAAESEISARVAENEAKAADAAAFASFQRQIQRHDAQVLRYLRCASDPEAAALRAATAHVTRSIDGRTGVAHDAVSGCQRCGAPRQPELQLLSPILYYLRDNVADFDSAIVYTCSADCELASGQLADEVVVVEQFGAASSC